MLLVDRAFDHDVEVQVLKSSLRYVHDLDNTARHILLILIKGLAVVLSGYAPIYGSWQWSRYASIDS